MLNRPRTPTVVQSIEEVVGAQLFHADRRTDMTKLVVADHNFDKASTKKILVSSIRPALLVTYIQVYLVFKYKYLYLLLSNSFCLRL